VPSNDLEKALSSDPFKLPRFHESHNLTLSSKYVIPISGKVVGVNQSAHTFTVQWLHKYTDRHNMAKENSHENVFKTADKTIYTVGSNKGSWNDLKKGVHVTVTATAGVADQVQITPGS
jgi:hypothetical protein